MDKSEIISILKQIALLSELKGENIFKVRAYLNGARALETLSEDLSLIIKENQLKKIKGIGAALEEKIKTLFKTGKLKFYDDLKKSVPSGLVEMVQLPGLGPKKARALFENLKIKSIGELEYACKENRLLKLDGFGEKTQNKILRAITFHCKNQDRHLYSQVIDQAEKFFKQLNKLPEIKRGSIAGSLRRCKETVKDIDIVCSTDKPTVVMKSFVSNPECDEIIVNGNTKSSIRLKSGIQVDLRCVSDEQYPFALHHFTGSKEHNTALRSRAKSMGFKMNEYGLFSGDNLVPCRDEEEIFKKLGVNFIPPELRENQGEIEYSEKNKFSELVDLKDIQGTFHIHTVYSDGRNTVEEMAEQSIKLGYKYIGISDHSQSAFYAHGLKADDISKQHREIEKVSKKYPQLKIFRGIESDILADGSLDYDEEILEKFDFVIASVHSRFKMDESEMTNRIINAIKNPYTTMLGHMTGRLLLSREPYSVNIHKIIDAAVEYNKIIELNANPHRLDIDWRYLKYGKEKGLKVCINPDAHQIEGLGDVKFGVGIARKGGLKKEDVVNTMNVKKIGSIFQSSQ